MTTHKYGTFRPMNPKRPPSLTKPQLIAILGHERREPHEPSKPEDIHLWRAGELVRPGYKRIYAGVIYECLQEHITQEDWTPPTVPALWKIAE